MSIVGYACFSPKDRRIVGYWLLFCAVLVFMMSIIGAITRLTESGLSMVEWRPFIGVIPPLSETEWQRIFTLYQQTPEYIYHNRGMTLEAFRQIFWWEWIHRLWGRLIGLAFVIPFLWFWKTGFLSRFLLSRLGILLVLGSLQALLGWFMVQSGLEDRPSVSHYRLAGHLLLSVVIMQGMISLFLRLCYPHTVSRTVRIAPSLYYFAHGMLVLVVITMIWGGFVAGLDAGGVYNTFPTMKGYWIPPEVVSLVPWWRNLFENTAMVQFCHRWLAITLWIGIMFFWIRTWYSDLPAVGKASVTLLAVLATMQIGIGIMTLVLEVPLWLGVMHQAGALMVITVLVWILHQLKPWCCPAPWQGGQEG